MTPEVRVWRQRSSSSSMGPSGPEGKGDPLPASRVRIRHREKGVAYLFFNRRSPSNMEHRKGWNHITECIHPDVLIYFVFSLLFVFLARNLSIDFEEVRYAFGWVELSSEFSLSAMEVCDIADRHNFFWFLSGLQ